MQIIYNHFPFLRRESETAAEASECAGVVGGRDGFWGMVDEIYDQGQGIDRDGAETLAVLQGLDVAAWNACMDAGGGSLAWRADLTRGSARGVNSTPTIFIAFVDENGEQTDLEFRGSQSFREMSDIIDSLLDRLQ